MDLGPFSFVKIPIQKFGVFRWDPDIFILGGRIVIYDANSVSLPFIFKARGNKGIKKTMYLFENNPNLLCEESVFECESDIFYL